MDKTAQLQGFMDQASATSDPLIQNANGYGYKYMQCPIGPNGPNGAQWMWVEYCFVLAYNLAPFRLYAHHKSVSPTQEALKRDGSRAASPKLTDPVCAIVLH